MNCFGSCMFHIGRTHLQRDYIACIGKIRLGCTLHFVVFSFPAVIFVMWGVSFQSVAVLQRSVLIPAFGRSSIKAGP